MKDPKLTKYEKDILDSIERGEWKSVSKDEKNRLVDIFKANQKDRMISIRVNSSDLESFKSKAEKAGIPYQTLLVSLMKRFVEGKVKLEI